MTSEEKKAWDRTYWGQRKDRANADRRTKYFKDNFDKIQARVASKVLEVKVKEAHPRQKINSKSDEEKQAFIRQVKRLPCQDCGNHFHPWVIEFDHRDPSQKEFSIARSFHNGNCSLKRIKAELAKCDGLCANCHRLRTVRRAEGLPATLPPPEYHI